MTITETPQAPAAPPAPRRPKTIWIVLALGIVVFLLGGAGGSYQSKLQEVLKQDNTAFLPESADSTKVANAAPGFNSVQTIPGFVVYQREGGLTADDRAKIGRDTAALRDVEGVAADGVAAVQPRNDSRAVAAIAVPLIAKRGDETVKFEDLGTFEEKILDTAKRNAPEGLQIYEAGPAGLIGAFSSAFEGLDTNLLFAALGVVFIVLLIVYRSPALPFIPLIAAGLALGAASIVIYNLAKNGTITLDGQSQGILSVLVVGAGTDYALLFISRFREELHEFASPLDAIIAAWRGTVAPIAASAVTVILGLICLSFADLKSTAGLGPVCAIGIAATALVMLFVLPLMLLFFGRFVHWLWPVGWVLLALDFKKRRVLDARWLFWPKRPALDPEINLLQTHGVWGRFADWLSRHARRSWIVTTVLLLLCIIGIGTLRTDGLSTAEGFTGKPAAVTGQEIYDANFDQGAGAPIQILTPAATVDEVIAKAKTVDGIRADGVCVQVDFAKVQAAVKAGGGAAAAGALSGNGCPPANLQVQPKDGQLLVNAPLTVSYDSPAAYATVDRMRAALREVDGARSYVGGQSAATADVRVASRDDRNLIIPIVLAVILVVLAFVLRAIVAPVLLIATVVLSFLAALGVSAIFFNHVFDFANSNPDFPLFAFVFLVALGIDYNIFLMTRVREEALQVGTRAGVTRGLAVTGGVITSAGLVLAATFVVLGIVPLVFLAQLGFTVAFGVLLDTIVVRSILVPALSYDIGKKIWWPGKLARATD